MNRIITQIGQSIYEWFFTKSAQDNMVALGKFASAVLGTSPTVNGLVCTPTAPASLQVSIGPGEIYALAPLEATGYGTLPADTAHQIVKQGMMLDPVLVSCAPPLTGGQAINYLIQAQYQDQDVSVDPTTGSAAPTVLQFYNSSNPSQPWQGPNNSGQTSNTFRTGIVAIQAKAGIASPTGSQVTPVPDTGWTGLWVVTVANGQTMITAGNIAVYPGAPFLTESLTQKIGQSAADTRYAALAGTASQIFSVANATLPQHAVPLAQADMRYLRPSQVSGIVGMSRNARISIETTSSSATYTADELIVETALGGTRYALANVSNAINLEIIGVGGVDKGRAPVSGFVALYVVYNPTTQMSALLAVNPTSDVAPEVYGGSDMPDGYTASALVSVWPTNENGQLIRGEQSDLLIHIDASVAMSTNSPQSTPTAISLEKIIPKNAKRIKAVFNAHSRAASTIQGSLYPTSAGYSGQGILAGNLPANVGTTGFVDVLITTPQTTYYTLASSAGTVNASVSVYGYFL